VFSVLQAKAITKKAMALEDRMTENDVTKSVLEFNKYLNRIEV
jgi:hypothetical protein